jgi:hypothetical protein
MQMHDALCIVLQCSTSSHAAWAKLAQHAMACYTRQIVSSTNQQLKLVELKQATAQRQPDNVTTLNATPLMCRI